MPLLLLSFDKNEACDIICQISYPSHIYFIWDVVVSSQVNMSIPRKSKHLKAYYNILKYSIIKPLYL